MTKLQEIRDDIVELIGRPKEVLTPGYDPTPGLNPGVRYSPNDPESAPNIPGTQGFHSGGGGISNEEQGRINIANAKRRQEAQRRQQEEQRILLEKLMKERDVKQREIRKTKQEQARSQTISGQLGYQTKEGFVSAKTFAFSSSEKARTRKSNIQSYKEYKGIESKYLADVEKKAYQKYKEQGLSNAQARQQASQWRRGTKSDIKASGGFSLSSNLFSGGISKNKRAEIDIIIPETKKRKDEFYNPLTESYISESITGRGSTGIIRIPTQEEKKKIKEQELKSSALFSSIPLVSQVKFFNYPLTKEQEEDIYGVSTPSMIGKFLDPRYNYKLAKEQEQLKQDVLEQRKVSKRVESAKEDILKSGISEEELKSGKITSTLTPSQESSLKKYNAIIDYALEEPSTKRLSKGRRTAFDILATSESKTVKVGGAALIRTGQTLPYFTPIGRALLGTDIALEGAKSYDLAETKGQKLLATGQVALGGALAYSGVKGIVGASTGTTIAGGATKIKAIKYVSYVGGTGLGLGVGAIDYYSTLKQTGSKEVALGAAIGSGGTIIGGIYAPKIREVSLFGKKPEQIVASKSLQKQVEPFTRQRATILLKTQKGKYILGKTKTGEIISLGGGIEKGQTPRTAAIAELQQETGLSLKDITGFKKSGKVVFPEETFHLYTGTLKSNIKIIPSSDIKSIVEISSKNLFIKGSTGQTALQPVSRFTFKGKVRSYEAGIINYLETGQQPTWLKVSTKTGDYFLGTQSRYNVPYSSQKQYLQGEELLLAHGTTEPAILKRYSLREKSFQIEASATKRGQAEGLYVQPPISSVKYPKITKLEGYTGKGSILKKSEVYSLPIKITKQSTKGYVGLSYLGFEGGQSSEIIIQSSMPKRTAFILRESSSKLVPTPKTLSGAESELLIPPKSIIGTEGRAEVFSIGLKKVYIQPTKILTTSNINKLRNIFQTSSYRTGASYITNPLLISSYSIGSISKSKQKVMPYYKKSSEGISYSISNYIKPYKTISYSKKEEYKVPYYNKYSPVGYKYKSYEPYKIIKPFYKKPAPPKTPGILLFKSLQLKMKAKRKPQIFKQKTRYQVSFTGASLGIKGTGLAPGGLSVRGYIKPKKNNKSNPLLFN